MIRRLCTISILISISFVPFTGINAQENLNVDCINQFYHNWNDGVFDVEVRGNHAYLACRDAGLRIVDVTDPEAAIDVATLDIPDADDVVLYGNYAFLSGSNRELHVIDISNPSLPTVVNTVELEGWIYRLRLHDHYLFACGGNPGITIFDASDPLGMPVVWTSGEGYTVYDVKIYDDVAYVVSHSLRMLDISDITSPRSLGTYRPGPYTEITGLSISGDYMYLSSGMDGLQVVHLESLELVAELPELAYSFDVDIVDGYVYVHFGEPECPLAIVDITVPEEPAVLSIYYPPEELWGFQVVDDLVYVADAMHGLRFVDVADRTLPIEIAAHNHYGRNYDVSVFGDYAYVDQDFMVKIIDIADKQDPRVVGCIEAGWGYRAIEVIGDMAFVTKRGTTVFQAMDISNPESLTMVGELANPDEYTYYNSAIYGTYAYLFRNSGIRIVDISDPTDMQCVGLLEQNVRNAEVELWENYLFFTDRDYRTIALDLTDPSNPIQIGISAPGERCRGLAADEGTLVVALRSRLNLYDIHNLGNWQSLSQIELPVEFDNTVTGIELIGSRLHVSVHPYGLVVYDISDRTAPALVGNYRTPGSANGIAMSGDVAVIADWDNLGFYECTGVVSAAPSDAPLTPSSFALSNYPNPFNATTQIEFQIPIADRVSLAVFDLLGREVVSLADRRFTAGTHTVRWDGTNAGGLTVASGRYFVVARSENAVRTLPVILLK